MTNSPRTAPRFPVVHHLRTMRKPNPGRDLLANPAGLLVLCVTECEERPTEICPVRNWPRNIYIYPVRGHGPQFSLEKYPFGAPLALQATFYPPARGPNDTLSSPLGQHILDYEPAHGFVIPPFAMYDGFSDPYDHMFNFNQTMILNAGNDRLLCKVFPASLKGPSLAWFHKLPRGFLNSFGELWTAFTTQYLCSVRQKGNISSLQSIFKRDDESIRDFTRRFGQSVQQIDTYSMDAVLQNFQRSFGPTTPFFQSLSLDPPATMEELYQRTDKYSILEDNIRAASQTVMITAQSGKPTTKNQPEHKGSQGKDQKHPQEQFEKKRDPPQFTPLTSPTTDCFPSSGTTSSLSGLRPCRRTRTNVTGH